MKIVWYYPFVVRKCFGVDPIDFLKNFTKCEGSVNPSVNPISEIVLSVYSNSLFDSFITKTDIISAAD